MRNWRINLILFFLILFWLAIISKLFFIQIVQGDFYKALAKGLQSREEEIFRERGEIFFHNGEPLAINMDWQLVFASPSEVKEKEKTAEILSQILNLDKDLILKNLQQDGLYVPIKKKLTKEELDNLKKINLAGIYLGQESGRYYPQETLASKVIGFLDAQNQGQYGLEGYYDEILRGKKKSPGSDLILTVDYSIQFTAEQLLKKANEELKIESGEIIVVVPDSGKILALASYPNFNPNKYSEVDNFEIFQNPAIQKIFEPGSVFKPFTMAAGLDQGKITPQTTYIDSGIVTIGGYKIYNYNQRTWGQKTMTEVLEKSINTGAVFAERQVGNNIFLDYVKRFGFFEPTGTDLQGEIFSENKEFQKGYEINFATAAFGQGIEMTPMNLLRAFGVIANGGKLVKPYVVEKIKEKNGILETKPEIENDSVISSKAISQLTAMLVSVVEQGYAKSAKIPGYYVGGKTGTAQVSFSALGINKPGYSEKTVQSFVGFAPAFNPRFLIMVKLDNPKTKTAEYSAVPIFHELAKYIIDYYQIPPDYE